MGIINSFDIRKTTVSKTNTSLAMAHHDVEIFSHILNSKSKVELEKYPSNNKKNS